MVRLRYILPTFVGGWTTFTFTFTRLVYGLIAFTHVATPVTAPTYTRRVVPVGFPHGACQHGYVLLLLLLRCPGWAIAVGSPVGDLVGGYGCYVVPFTLCYVGWTFGYAVVTLPLPIYLFFCCWIYYGDWLIVITYYCIILLIRLPIYPVTGDYSLHCRYLIWTTLMPLLDLFSHYFDTHSVAPLRLLLD